MNSSIKIGMWILIILSGGISTNANASILTDSLVIQFANRTKLVIYAPDKAGIQALSAYDLNKIVREMGMKLDSVRNGQTIISIDEQSGKRYLRDTTVLVVTRDKNKVSIVIPKKNESTSDTIKVNISRDEKKPDSDGKDYKVALSSRKDKGMNRFFAVQLGLNTLITENILSAYPSNQYDLNPLGSRYIGFSFGQRPTLIRGKSARLSIQYGLELFWNNFMFENNVTVLKGPTQVVVSDISGNVQKSKLTICNLQLPVVPRLSFYNGSGRKIFHVGVGGYVGYRIDSYTKVKYSNSDRDREHSSFYLNNLRYGLVGHLGILKTNLFVKYDLNPVFQEGKGPDVRTLSFGISL